MPVCPDTREYRSVAAPLAAVAENRQVQSDYYVEGYATTFDQPYELYEFDGVKYFEVISSRAFDGANLSDVIFQYDHEGRVLARLSNQTLLLQTNAKGLFVAADLSKSDAARSIYEDITNGLVTKMSWAFTVAEEKYDKATRTRTILRVGKVYDVSAVSVPANDATTISARSFAEGRHSVELEECQKRARQRLKLKLELEALNNENAT